MVCKALQKAVQERAITFVFFTLEISNKNSVYKMQYQSTVAAFFVVVTFFGCVT